MKSDPWNYCYYYMSMSVCLYAVYMCVALVTMYIWAHMHRSSWLGVTEKPLYSLCTFS